MRIGVLGGTGTAGSQAVAALERRGHEVRVLARSSGLDVTTGAGLDAALAGLNTLVDCLGVEKATERAARPVLVDGLRSTLERAAHLGVDHVVSLSILNCDRIPMGYYRTKLAQEEVIRTATMPGTVLRATQFPQLLDRAWRAMRSTGIIAAPSGLLSPFDPRDVGEHLADAVEAGPHGPPLLQLCGPQELQVREAAYAWRAANCSRRPVVPLPAVGGALRARTVVRRAGTTGSRHIVGRLGAEAGVAGVDPLRRGCRPCLARHAARPTAGAHSPGTL